VQSASTVRLLRAILPPGVGVEAKPAADRDGDWRIRIAGHPLRARQVRGVALSSVRDAMSTRPLVQLLILTRVTPGMRLLLADAGMNWVDTTGAAQIAFGTVVVSRDPAPVTQPTPEPRWTQGVLGTAEALLSGTPSTVSAVAEATGMAPSSVGVALRNLTDLGLLSSAAARGRKSGRQVIDPDVLLRSYTDAVNRTPARAEISVGVLWRDPLAELAKVAKAWTAADIRWGATSAIAAAALAPVATQVAPLQVYVDAPSPALLVAAAQTAGLDLLPGGRLALHPFPTTATATMVSIDASSGLPLVSWPRVYADIFHAGVRGEEAADHLLEVMRRGRR